MLFPVVADVGTPVAKVSPRLRLDLKTKVASVLWKSKKMKATVEEYMKDPENIRLKGSIHSAVHDHLDDDEAWQCRDEDKEVGSESEEGNGKGNGGFNSFDDGDGGSDVEDGDGRLQEIGKGNNTNNAKYEEMCSKLQMQIRQMQEKAFTQEANELQAKNKKEK
jgi:hypothetical protein